jgi:membrane-bound lytic murein transglycosylase D
MGQIIPVKYIKWLFSLNLLCASILAFGFSTKEEVNKCIKQVIIPTCRNVEFSFAGERIPMEDPEVYERMDRELLVNTYWQSNMLLSLKLADKYFPQIETILREYGVPDDFKYLALAESGMRDVTSNAGAAGKWQFMKGTASNYGLVVNDEIDERYHIEKATRAACMYLLEGKNQISTWCGVAAGYNMGKAGIIRKMEEQQESSYFNLWLNQETARYVFRIVALKEIHKNPSKYGYYYGKEDLYPIIDAEKVMLYLPNYDLVTFAKNRGTTFKILKYLNPWIKDTKITTLKDSVEILMPVLKK